MDFAKDQVAGYESFNSQEYYQLAYDVAKDVKGGVYGTHNLESYDLIWSPSGKTCSEHLFSLQSKSGDELYGTLFTYHYCGMTNEKGHIENSLTVGNSKHWYLLFEENDYRVDKGVLHCWIREGSDTSWGGGSYFPNFGKWQEMVMNREAPFDNSEVTARLALRRGRFGAVLRLHDEIQPASDRSNLATYRCQLSVLALCRCYSDYGRGFERVERPE